MRIVIAVTAGAGAALVAASMLGVAAAEAPAPSPARSVSADGVATVPIAQGADAAAASAVYRQGMAAAVSDAHGKAEFLAVSVGAALGPAQSVVEGGGYISCTGAGSEYVEYSGEQPDFGSPAAVVSPGVVRSSAAAPALHRPAAKPRKPAKVRSGRAASVAGCTLSTQVGVAYAMQ